MAAIGQRVVRAQHEAERVCQGRDKGLAWCAVQRMKTGLKATTQERDYLRAQTEAAFKYLSVYAAGATPARSDPWAQAKSPPPKLRQPRAKLALP